ncbi:hypothetical protein EKK58_01955 [Candidatus Dependentiae bacterium]|nr:MAG: hypothetical protein EKK58_01955 [Candidatus Dependentiae bacterium]
MLKYIRMSIIILSMPVIVGLRCSDNTIDTLGIKKMEKLLQEFPSSSHNALSNMPFIQQKCEELSLKDPLYDNGLEEVIAYCYWVDAEKFGKKQDGIDQIKSYFLFCI